MQRSDDPGIELRFREHTGCPALSNDILDLGHPCRARRDSVAQRDGGARLDPKARLEIVIGVVKNDERTPLKGGKLRL